jgi:hypothetical protein
MSCGWFPMDWGEIAEWARQNPDRIPTTLAELSTYPVAFRRVLVNIVTPEQRTALWREHLESFIGADSTLDDAQRQLVRDAIEELPMLFGGDRAVFEERAKAFEARMKDVLTREQAYHMFGMIGPPEPPDGLPLPPGAVPRQRPRPPRPRRPEAT